MPDEYWYLLYRALARVGFPAEALRPGNRSRSLCLFLHDRPDVTGAVCACVWAQLGLRRAPDLSQVTLADGNLLFNLGSVLPNRLVVGVLYCLVHWGADEHETRVRARLRPLFVAFLYAGLPGLPGGPKLSQFLALEWVIGKKVNKLIARGFCLLLVSCFG